MPTKPTHIAIRSTALLLLAALFWGLFFGNGTHIHFLDHHHHDQDHKHLVAHAHHDTMSEHYESDGVAALGDSQHQHSVATLSIEANRIAALSAEQTLPFRDRNLVTPILISFAGLDSYDECDYGVPPPLIDRSNEYYHSFAFRGPPLTL